MKIINTKDEIANRIIFSELVNNFKMHRKTETKPFFKKNKKILLLSTPEFFLLRQITANLKKMLQIVFQYHINKKKILLVGEKSLLKKKQKLYTKKKTNHFFVVRSAWIKGLLSNNKKLKKFLTKKNRSFRRIKNPRLIVISERCKFIDAERYSRRIPSITIADETFDPKSHYYKNSTYSIYIGAINKIREKKFQSFLLGLTEKIIKLPKLRRKRPAKKKLNPKLKFKIIFKKGGQVVYKARMKKRKKNKQYFKKIQKQNWYKNQSGPRPASHERGQYQMETTHKRYTDQRQSGPRPAKTGGILPSITP